MCRNKISSHLTDRKNMAFQPPLTRQKLCPGTVNNACGSGGGLCTPFKVDFQVASFGTCVNGCLVASMSKRLSALQNGQGKLLIALEPFQISSHHKQDTRPSICHLFEAPSNCPPQRRACHGCLGRQVRSSWDSFMVRPDIAHFVETTAGALSNLPEHLFWSPCLTTSSDFSANCLIWVSGFSNSATRRNITTRSQRGPPVRLGTTTHRTLDPCSR